MTTFGVFNLRTYNEARYYLYHYADEHAHNQSDETPARMNYADTIVMELPNHYSDTWYDIASQYVERHRAAGDASIVGGRRHRRRNTRSRHRGRKSMRRSSRKSSRMTSRRTSRSFI